METKTIGNGNHRLIYETANMLSSSPEFIWNKIGDRLFQFCYKFISFLPLSPSRFVHSLSQKQIFISRINYSALRFHAEVLGLANLRNPIQFRTSSNEKTKLNENKFPNGKRCVCSALLLLLLLISIFGNFTINATASVTFNVEWMRMAAKMFHSA